MIKHKQWQLEKLNKGHETNNLQTNTKWNWSDLQAILIFIRIVVDDFPFDKDELTENHSGYVYLRH